MREHPGFSTVLACLAVLVETSFIPAARVLGQRKKKSLFWADNPKEPCSLGLFRLGPKRKATKPSRRNCGHPRATGATFRGPDPSKELKVVTMSGYDEI